MISPSPPSANSPPTASISRSSRKDEQGATGIAIINVGEGGENYISLIGGSNLRMDESDVERARPALEKAEVLLLQLEVPLAASLAGRGHRQGAWRHRHPRSRPGARRTGFRPMC